MEALAEALLEFTCWTVRPDPSLRLVEDDPFTFQQYTLKFFESGFRPLTNLAFRVDHTMPWNWVVITQCS